MSYSAIIVAHFFKKNLTQEVVQCHPALLICPLQLEQEVLRRQRSHHSLYVVVATLHQDAF